MLQCALVKTPPILLHDFWAIVRHSLNACSNGADCISLAVHLHLRSSPTEEPCYPSPSQHIVRDRHYALNTHGTQICGGAHCSESTIDSRHPPYKSYGILFNPKSFVCL